MWREDGIKMEQMNKNRIQEVTMLVWGGTMPLCILCDTDSCQSILRASRKEKEMLFASMTSESV